MAQQPFPDLGGLVRGVVAGHRVQVRVTGDGVVDELGEPDEFLVPVLAAGPGDHGPAAGLEHREQAGGAGGRLCGNVAPVLLAAAGC
ncbi:MAG TPA: hypothetical protein VFQ44_07420 [Streptosporangiaceae bacterium]|nr:hypothetical protein [Streptosporangiaceae bacterium]